MNIRNSALAFSAAMFLFAGCQLGPEHSQELKTPGNSPTGLALFKLSASPDSPFMQTAHRALLTVSAADMVTMAFDLALCESGILDTVDNIPVGDLRFFALEISDTNGIVCYSGCATASVAAGEPVNVRIALKPVSGSAVIEAYLDDRSAGVAGLKAIKDGGVRTDLDVIRNDNWGATPEIVVSTTRGGGSLPYGSAEGGIMLIEFDLSTITTPVEKATLQLHVVLTKMPSEGDFSEIAVHRIVPSAERTPWIEGNGNWYLDRDGFYDYPYPTWMQNVDSAYGVAWVGALDGGDANNSTRPDFDPAVEAAATVVHPAKGKIVSWDITDLVNGWITGHYENYGLVVRNVRSDGTFREVFFASRECEAYGSGFHGFVPGPRLVLQ